MKGVIPIKPIRPIRHINPIKPIISIVLAMLLVACGGQQEENLSAVDTVTDDYGRTVVVPSEPQRVVSLSPAVTEIMFALGAGEMLVGRTDFCAYPSEAASIPSIGGISNLNVEHIFALQPDLVISGSMIPKRATDQMDAMGTPIVCVVEKPGFEALYDNITAIGRLVGKEHEADSLNKVLSCELLALSEADAIVTRQPHNTHNSQHTAPTCYYVVGFGAGGNFTAGGNTFINDIIRMAGGRNIAEDIDGWSYSMEALVKEDPDYIIVRREDSAAFCAMRPYNTLRAVREGRVIGIESGMLDLQVPRNIDAIIYLRDRMNNR